MFSVLFLLQGLRVVNVVGFKRSYGYLDEILTLAKPFGKVVRHLVLHSRPEVNFPTILNFLIFCN